MTEFEKEFLSKIDSGYLFDNSIPRDENELSKLIYKLKVVDTIYGEIYFRPHCKSVTLIRTILQAGDRYFALDWERGSGCPNSFFSQPREVEKIERVKTVIEVDWK